jgi:hypothetical protein
MLFVNAKKNAMTYDITPQGQLPLRPEHADQIKKLLMRTNMFKKKEQVIVEFTDENKTHIGDLNQDQAVQVINYLQELDVKGNKMRLKMLSIGYEMHFDEPMTAAEEAMERKYINLKHVRAWCQSERCKYRKDLNSLDPFELGEVLTQFELVRDSYLKERSKRHEQKNDRTKSH